MKSNDVLPAKRIVDRLDLQILLAVIVIFVSSWAYLSSIICSFTIATSYNVRLTYILVQYIVTLYLMLCLYLSSIKGRFIFVEDKDISLISQKWVDVFMQSWLVVTIVCVLAIVTAYLIPYSWVMLGYLFIVGSIYYLRRNCFSNKYIVAIISLISIMFPLYISAMTLSMVDVTILRDKDYYNVGEKTLITTQVKGYACEYELFELQKDGLYPNSTFLKHKNMVLIDTSNLRENKISVGVIGPIRSFEDFFVYPLCLMADVKYNSNGFEEIFVRYKRVDINVRP